MTSVDKYFGRVYDSKKYTCLHFVRDVWQDYTGKDIGEALASFFKLDQRRPNKSHLKSFERILHPKDPCFVVFSRPRAIIHIGIYIRGRVLHLTERGSEFQPIDVVRLGFSDIRFFTC